MKIGFANNDTPKKEINNLGLFAVLASIVMTLAGFVAAGIWGAKHK